MHKGHSPCFFYFSLTWLNCGGSLHWFNRLINGRDLFLSNWFHLPKLLRCRGLIPFWTNNIIPWWFLIKILIALLHDLGSGYLYLRANAVSLNQWSGAFEITKGFFLVSLEIMHKIIHNINLTNSTDEVNDLVNHCVLIFLFTVGTVRIFYWNFYFHPVLIDYEAILQRKITITKWVIDVGALF